MTDNKSHSNDVVPLGQPDLDPAFVTVRNTVLTRISTEEAERQLTEMHLDMASISFEGDDDFQQFDAGLIAQPTGMQIPSSQILGHDPVREDEQDEFATDGDGIDDGSIVAQISERIVDLGNEGASEADDFNLAMFEGLQLQTLEAAQTTEAALPADHAGEAETVPAIAVDGADFGDLDLADAGLVLASEAVSDDVSDDNSDSHSMAEVAEVTEGSLLDMTLDPASRDEPSAPAAQPDTSLVDYDFGDDADWNTALESPSEAPATEALTALVLPAEEAPEELVIESLDLTSFAEEPEPVATLVVPEETSEEPFQFPTDDVVIPEAVPEGQPSDDGVLDLKLFGLDDVQPVTVAPADEGVAEGIQSAAVEDFSLDASLFASADEAAEDASLHEPPVDEFTPVHTGLIETDEDVADPEAIDMLAVLSATTEEDEADVSQAIEAPVYGALPGERISAEPAADVPEVVAMMNQEPDEVVPEPEVEQVAAIADEVAAPAEIAKKTKVRQKIPFLPIAASIAAIGMAGVGAYYYHSIGMPGLSQYFGNQDIGMDMGGADQFAQSVVPADFVPTPLPTNPTSPAPAPIDAAYAPGVDAQPVPESAELVAIFSELDAALDTLSEAIADIPAAPAEVTAEVSVDDLFSGLTEFELPTGEIAAEVLAEVAVEVELPEVVVAETPDPDIQAAPAESGGVSEIQEAFAQQLITLQADVEDLKSAIASPGQASAVGEVMIEVSRLAEQIAVINARLMGVEGRIASTIPTITLPGANPNDDALMRMQRQIEDLSTNVGIIARLATSGGSATVPGFNAIATERPNNAAPVPQPRPQFEAPRISDSPAQASGFTISSKQTGGAALGKVQVGDFVENYGYVLKIVPLAGSGKLVQMENGTVLVE